MTSSAPGLEPVRTSACDASPHFSEPSPSEAYEIKTELTLPWGLVVPGAVPGTLRYGLTESSRQPLEKELRYCGFIGKGTETRSRTRCLGDTATSLGNGGSRPTGANM